MITWITALLNNQKQNHRLYRYLKLYLVTEDDGNIPPLNVNFVVFARQKFSSFDENEKSFIYYVKKFNPPQNFQGI